MKFSRQSIFLKALIFEAKAGLGSFAWKSIVKVLKIIASGTKWRIGNGAKWRIWLPGNGEGRVTSPISVQAENSIVSELIDAAIGSWNSALVDSLFHTAEANLIKSIPLTYRPQDDVLYWTMCIDGSYSVKTSYKILCEENVHVGNASPNFSLPKSFWSMLWKLKVSMKVKHFL